MYIRSVRAFGIHSYMNVWIDFLVEVISDDYDKAKEIATQAFEEWNSSDSTETVFDYIKDALINNRISADIYILNE